MNKAAKKLKRKRKRINWKNSSGMRFGRWTVLEWLSSDQHSHTIWCKCDCGTTRKVKSSNLSSGGSTSCGCYSKERSSKENRTHGFSRNKIYRHYYAMLDRCRNRKTYIDKNVRVCDRWLFGEKGKSGIACFAEDMGRVPDGYITVERKDNSGIYEPSNCKWGSRLEQNNNKDTNVYISYQGVTKTRPQWARLLGITNLALRARFRRGQSVEQAFKGVGFLQKQTP